MPRTGQSIVFYNGTPQHLWQVEHHRGEIGCYFCKPDNFPPMLPYCSLCCCCGNVIVMPDDTDPMNEAMEVCTECQERFDQEEIDDWDDEPLEDNEYSFPWPERREP